MSGVRSLVALLLVVLVAFLALLSLPVTEPGTRLVVRALATITDMDLEHESGALLGDLSMAHIRIPTEDAIIVLDDVQVRLDRGCLGRGEVCLLGLRVKSLDVEILFPEDQPDDESGSFLPLPFEIYADSVSLEAARVHWEDADIDIGAVRGDVSVLGERITVSDAVAGGVHLHMPDDGSESDDSDLPEVDLPLELVVDNATIHDASWDIYELRNHYHEITLSGRWAGTHMQVSGGQLNNKQWGRVELAGAMIFEHPYGLEVDARIETATPPLWEGLHHSPGELSLRGTLAALQYSGRLCSEGLPVSFDGGVDLLSTGLPLVLNAEGGCSQSGATALADFPGLDAVPDWHLSHDWTLAASGDLDQQYVDLHGQLAGPDYGPVEVRLQGVHGGDRVKLQRLLATRREGEQGLEMDGLLDYSQHLGWDMKMRLDKLVLPPQLQPVAGWLSGELASAGTLVGDSWQVAFSDMALTGVVNDLPASIRGTLQVNQDLVFAGSDLDAELNGMSLQIAERAGAFPRAELSISSLGAWLEGAEGALQASLDWDQQRQAVSVAGKATGLGWQGSEVEALDIDGQYQYRQGHQRLALRGRVSGVSFGDASLDTIRMDLQGTPAEHRLSIDVAGDHAASIAVDGGMQAGSWSGYLQPSRLRLGDSHWSLDKTVSMQFDRQQAQLLLSPHCWQEIDTGLCFEQLQLGDSGAATIALSGDLIRFTELLPERFSVTGATRARVDVRWAELEIQQLEASLKVDSGELRENLLGGEWTDLSWDYLTLDYRGDRDQGTLRGVMQQDGVKRLMLDASLPSVVDGPLSGKLVLQDLELRAIENFVDAFSKLRGNIAGTLMFAGRVDAPEITGSIVLENGLASLSRSPTSLEEVTLEARFLGARAELNGQLSLGGGSSQLRGELGWREKLYLRLAMSGTDKQIDIPPYGRVIVNEDLLLEMLPDRIALSGEVAIPRGKLELQEVPERAVEVSTDVLLFDGQGNPLGEASGAPVAINVSVNIEDQLRVAMEGMSGRLGGELRLLQSPRAPLQLLGGLKIVEGRFDMLGPRFNVTRGQLSFVGAVDNPQLNIALERKISEDQVTVGIRVGGVLERPELDFYSRPSLPEEEVMAYIFGGRKIDRTGNSDSLALALAMTSGLMQSQGILKGVSLGVEGRDSKARAAIGGYVSDRIYMSYGVGLYTPINTLTVRMDILRNFWLEVVSGLENSADIYYAWSR